MEIVAFYLKIRLPSSAYDTQNTETVQNFKILLPYLSIYSCGEVGQSPSVLKQQVGSLYQLQIKEWNTGNWQRIAEILGGNPTSETLFPSRSYSDTPRMQRAFALGIRVLGSADLVASNMVFQEATYSEPLFIHRTCSPVAFYYEVLGVPDTVVARAT